MPLTIEYMYGHCVELVGADGTTIISAVRFIHPGHKNCGISTVRHQVSLDTVNDTTEGGRSKTNFNCPALAPLPALNKLHICCTV